MLEAFQCHDGDLGHGLYLYERFGGPPEFFGYKDFPGRIAAYAEFFRDHGIRPGTRVLFPFETSSAVIFSFLGLMEVGAVPMSIKPRNSGASKESYLAYLTRITRDFGAERMLRVPSLAGLEPPLPALPLPPATIGKAGARLRTPPDTELAFVQFSSGSTSLPKGIPVRHDKLRASLNMILRNDRRTPEDRVSSWLPLYHDMGLVGGLLSCLMRGCDLLLAEPVTFLFDARGWWEHLSQERCAGTVIPQFAIDYSLKMMRDTTPEELAAIDLSELRRIYLGSEPINIRNLTEFLDFMGPAQLRRDSFMPCYGMAEAVLLVSSRPPYSDLRIVSSPSGIPAISVGCPMPEFTVRLRGEDGRVCGDDELGEVELAGGSLADSYFGPSPLRGDDGYYATGDIGFINDGELFITGRIGDRIKVNGQSLFATDFEQVVEQLPFVRGRAAVAQVDGRILVFTEVQRTAREDPEGSRARIVEHLARSIGVTVQPLDIHYLRPRQMLRTSSGKLQRRAIAEAFQRGLLKMHRR